MLILRANGNLNNLVYVHTHTHIYMYLLFSCYFLMQEKLFLSFIIEMFGLRQAAVSVKH